MKSYAWRAFGIRLIVIAAVTVASATSSIASSVGELEKLRARALELVNQARQSEGLKPLEIGPYVNNAALSHARDMLQRDYYSHTSPGGKTVQDRYVAAGGSEWRLAAENIARCAACPSPPDVDAIERLHSGWMNSPGHRRNILREGLTEFGFGVVSGPDQGLYAVQVFAGPGVPQGKGEAAVISADKQIDVAASAINSARDEIGAPAIESSAVLSDLARSVLPQPDKGELAIDQSIKLYDRLPSDQARAWKTLSLLAASCGGCGVDATRADVRFFLQQWLDNPDYRKKLLTTDLTHIGFAVATNGQGKKIGIAVLGEQR